MTIEEEKSKKIEPSFDSAELFEGEYALVLPSAYPFFPALVGFIGVIESIVKGGAGAHILIRGKTYLIPSVAMRSLPDEMIELFNYADGVAGYKFNKAAKEAIVAQNKSWMLTGTPMFDQACEMATIAVNKKLAQQREIDK
jgi:hypothetical protein